MLTVCIGRQSIRQSPLLSKFVATREQAAARQSRVSGHRPHHQVDTTVDLQPVGNFSKIKHHHN